MTELHDESMETEPDIEGPAPVKYSRVNTTGDTPAKERRRDMKKNPEEKKKEKLWESIVNEASKDGDSESDDEERI